MGGGGGGGGIKVHFGLCENGEKKAVVKKPIINCGQYKTRTADYLLRTGYKIRTRYKTRPGRYGLGIKHRQGVKRGLQTADWV